MEKTGIYRERLSLPSLLSHAPADGMHQAPFLVRLRQVKEAQRQRPHPLTDRVSEVRGTVGPDGLERISSQRLADVLGLEPKERTASMWREIRMGMCEQGWTAVRFRAIGGRGHHQHVRGFARPAK